MKGPKLSEHIMYSWSTTLWSIKYTCFMFQHVKLLLKANRIRVRDRARHSLSQLYWIFTQRNWQISYSQLRQCNLPVLLTEFSPSTCHILSFCQSMRSSVLFLYLHELFSYVNIWYGMFRVFWNVLLGWTQNTYRKLFYKMFSMKYGKFHVFIENITKFS